jgi:aspartyl-tRNA(Asn)/glutamyl-tRNA(Gln) amidotransferase subunit C
MPGVEFDVAHVAKLCRLELTAEEAERFQVQLGGIIDYMKHIDRLDLTGIEATAHAVARFDVCREDEPEPGLAREDALRNAPQTTQHQFAVTKVVE